MLIHLFIGLGLTFIGIVTLSNEDKLIQFERAVGRAIKRKFSKPEKVVVIPGESEESEESKKARFATGAAAGNELYAMGGDINA